MNDPTMISNIFKIKYEKLNSYFNIYLKNIKNRKRFLFLIDIGKTINIIISILKKNSIILTKKQKQKILISLLNIIAHYRHYFYSVHNSTNSFILYCSNQDDYDEYEEYISEINDISKFLPGIILIPNFKSKNKYFYIHLISHMISHLRIVSNNKNRDLITISLENNNLEYQYLMANPNTYFLRISSNNDIVLDYKKIWLKNGITCEDDINSLKNEFNLKRLIIPYLIYYKKINTDLELKPVIKNRNTILLNTLERSKYTTEDIINIYVNYLECTKEEKELLINKIKEILFIYNTNIKPFVKELIKNWNKKLSDKKIININQYSEVLNLYNINILWLQENMGL